MTKPSTSTTSINSTDPISEALPQLRPSSSLSPDAERLLAFDDMAELIRLYDVEGWTLEKEVRLLISIIDNTESDTVRLRALNQLQARRTELLKKSGLLETATKVHRSDGSGQEALSSNLVAAALGQQTAKKSQVKKRSEYEREYARQKLADAEREAENARTRTPRNRDAKSGKFVRVRPDGDVAKRDGNRIKSDGGSSGKDSKRGSIDAGGQGGASGTATLHKPPTDIVPGGIARTGV